MARSAHRAKATSSSRQQNITRKRKTAIPTMTHPRTGRSSSSRSRLARSASTMSYERTPGGGTRTRKVITPQSTPQQPRSSRTTSGSGARRRSNSVQRYPTVHVHTNAQHHPQHHHPHHHHNHLPPYHRPEGSDAGSVSSAPSLKHFREFREPSSTKSGAKKIYRDDSPANSKKSHPETPQKHIKTARKLIEGRSALRFIFFSCKRDGKTPLSMRVWVVVDIPFKFDSVQHNQN